MTDQDDVSITEHVTNGHQDLIAASGRHTTVLVVVDRDAPPAQIPDELAYVGFEVQDRLRIQQPGEDAAEGTKYGDRLSGAPWREEDDDGLRADGGRELIDSGTPVGLDRRSHGDRVRVEYEPYDGSEAAIEGRVVGLKRSQAHGRTHEQAIVEAQDGSKYLIQAGGGIAREHEGDLAAWASIGYGAVVVGGECDV